ncbi:MAG: phosphate signaling complex protein PhoU [Planctomycetes bacterium]|nr:phosphate signaling complex protein PhoU [Planctomycetota bacterium]
MSRRFDQELGKLKASVAEMGKVAQRMVANTRTVLVDWKPGRIADVRKDEESMDGFQRAIDEETVRLIAVFTPVAGDLRLLLMTTRITAELERIGDQSVRICKHVEKLFEEPPLKPLVDIPRMAEIGGAMIEKAIHCFLEDDDSEAHEVIRMDEPVDQLNEQIDRELLTYMMGDPRTVQRALGLMFVSRALERIGDHAASIAEDVVFVIEGKDVRHLPPE